MLDRYQMRDRWKTTVPGMEPATLRVRDRDEQGLALQSFTDYDLSRVKFRPQDSSESIQDGVVISALPEADVEVWRDALDAAGAPDPREGDLYVRTADGTAWRVRKVNTKMFSEVIWAKCVQEMAVA